MTDDKRKEEKNRDLDSPVIPNPSPNYNESKPLKTENKENETTDNELVNSIKPQAEPKAEPQPHKIPAYPSDATPMSPNDERTWAMLAHLSILLNLVTGFLGGAAAIVIYFVFKDRSRLVAYHAMQSFVFQTITWLGAGLLSGIFIGFGSVLGFLIIPLLCLIPGFLILLLIPISLIYGIVGGVQVNNGDDFRYWQVGDWVRDILEPKPIL